MATKNKRNAIIISNKSKHQYERGRIRRKTHNICLTSSVNNVLLWERVALFVPHQESNFTKRFQKELQESIFKRNYTFLLEYLPLTKRLYDTISYNVNPMMLLPTLDLLPREI